MFDRKNDVARNKKRADAIVYAGAADEIVLTQSDFESEEEFRRWKAWSDADYKSDATMAWGIMILLHSPSMTGGEFLLRAPNGAVEL